MSLHETVLFFYGIWLKSESEVFRKIRKKCGSSREFVERLRGDPTFKSLFSNFENGLGTDQSGDIWEDEVLLLDDMWAQGNDPICIGYEMTADQIGDLFLGIRAVQFRLEYGDNATLTLPNTPTAEWDRLLQAKCEVHGIDWAERPASYPKPLYPASYVSDYKPTFQVWQCGLGGIEGMGLFCYGTILHNTEAYQLIREIEEPPPEYPSYLAVPKHRRDRWQEAWYEWRIGEEGVDELDHKWERSDDPVFINRLEYQGNANFVLGIRSVKFEAPSLKKTSFELPFVNTEEWDRLLRAKCEAHGIAWRDPQFHLCAEVWT